MLGKGAQLYLVLEQHFQSPGGLGRGHWPLPRSRVLEPQCTHTHTHTNARLRGCLCLQSEMVPQTILRGNSLP